MSTRVKMIHVSTGRIVRVNLHPSQGRIFSTNGQDSYAGRLKEMNQKGFRLMTAADKTFNHKRSASK